MGLHRGMVSHRSKRHTAKRIWGQMQIVSQAINFKTLIFLVFPKTQFSMNLQSPTGCTVHTSPHSLQLRAPAVLGPPPAPPKANAGWGVLWTWGVLCSGQGWAASGHQDLPVLGGTLSLSPACEAVSKLQTNSRIQLCSPGPKYIKCG